MRIAFFAMIVLLTHSDFALADEAKLKRWMIQELQPSGMVQVRVIEGWSGRVIPQTEITQQLIFKQTMSQAEASKFKPETIKPKVNLRYRSIGLALPLSPRPLWEVTKMQWDASDEVAYSAWIAQNANEQFLAGSGMNVDCADAGYLFRWVYAHDHLLPVANTLVGSGKLFGHFSGSLDWDGLKEDRDWKKDERFKQALRYFFDNTFTGTLVGDLYLTQINLQYVRPGSLFMIIRPHSGHTQTLVQVDSQNGISSIWGNEPSSGRLAKTQLLTEFQNQQTFGAWRAPRVMKQGASSDWELTPANEMPGFSSEQVDQFKNAGSEGDDFLDWLNERLHIVQRDEAKISPLINSFSQGLWMRLNVTSLGEVYCHATHCTPADADYDNYSTFSRDARLQKTQQKLLALFQKLGMNHPDVKENLKLIESFGNLIYGIPLTQRQVLLDPQLLSSFSPDPSLSFAERWGMPSSQNAEQNFYLSAQVLLNLLVERNQSVSNAVYLCRESCDPHSPSLQALNTERLDRAIRAPFQQVRLQAQSMRKGTLAGLRDFYRSIPLFSLQHHCSRGSGPCTFDDLVFADDSAQRFEHWKSDASASPDARWGF